jgi:hypothetical protein
MPENQSGQSDWDDEEIRLVVDDYFSMWRDETKGIPFNKAEHNRLLRAKINRSKGAIEFKHRNISAALQELGLPPITGYVPATHLQDALAIAVEAFVSANPSLIHPEALAPAELAEPTALFVEQPPALRPKVQRSAAVERLIRKFDPVMRDFRNRKLGRDGEELVLKTEREKLNKLERPDLAEKVEWVSQDKGDGAGFDILSFDKAGNELFLEVKTTVGPSTTPFYITRNELCFSKECPESFRLYRVYEFTRLPRMFELTAPLDQHVHLSSLSYKASFS